MAGNNYKTVLRITPDTPLLLPVQGYRPTPVMKWDKDDKGNRFVTDNQETDDNGVPLWTSKVNLTIKGFGSNVDIDVVDVVFPSKETPKTLPAEFLGQAR